MPYDCFISYASSDVEFAEKLKYYLEKQQADIRIWFDRDRLSPGFDWHLVIEQACDDSRVLLPVLTPRWKESEWTKFETYGAETVVPMIFEGEWSEVATPPLERFQAERIELSGSDTSVWPKLIGAIRRVSDQLPPRFADRMVLELPYGKCSFFVGRESELLSVHEKFHHKPSASLTQGRVLALSGLGGVGKTTFARHYVEKFWRCYTQIIWVNCELGVLNQLADAHATLDLEGQNKVAELKAIEMLHELNKHVPRLLILDNAEDEASIADWIPTTGACHTLITSRFRHWSAVVPIVLHLDVLPRDRALNFMLSRTGKERRAQLSNELRACEDLVERLGALPLALEQAGAYIHDQRIGFCEYLVDYEDCALSFLEKDAWGTTRHRDSVAKTLRLPLLKVTPGARAILRLCSFFSSTPIPVQMMVSGMATVLKRAAAFTEEELLAPQHAKFWIREELGQLKHYSLIELDGGAFGIHKLVQEVEMLSIACAERSGWLADAAALFSSVIPEISWREDRRKGWKAEDAAFWKLLLPHGLTILKHMGETVADSALLSSVGHACAETGEFKQALSYFQTAHQRLKDCVGANHSSTIDSLEDLGYIHRHCKQNEQSLAAFTAVHSHRKSERGDSDELALRALHNVAIVQSALGNTHDALENMHKVAETRSATVGKAHYDTVNSLQDLGWIYESMGKLAEAERHFRFAYETWSRDAKVGPVHPDTITAMINLAGALGRQERLAEAAQLYDEALDRLAENFEPDDRLALVALKRYARLMYFEGDLVRAGELYCRLVALLERSVGADNPETLQAIINLADVQSEGQVYEQAEITYRKALGKAEALSGPEHDEVLFISEKLAGVLELLGRVGEALPYLELQLRSYRISEDPLSVKLLGAIGHYGVCLDVADENVRAEAALQEALDGFEKKLGDSARETLTARDNLANLLEKTGQFDRARELRMKCVEVRAGRLDKKPLDARMLARDYFLIGDYQKAEQLLLQLLDSDFEVSSTRCHLARVLLLMGKESEARRETENAWRSREVVPSYVLPRILFLRLVFSVLDGDESDTASQLGKLKTALERPDAHGKWSIEPILIYLEPRLCNEHQMLLKALAGALNHPAYEKNLDRLMMWRQACALDIEC